MFVKTFDYNCIGDIIAMYCKLPYQKRMQIVGRDWRLTVRTLSNEVLLYERLHLVGDVELRKMPNIRKVRAETVQGVGRESSSKYLLNETEFYLRYTYTWKSDIEICT